LQAKFTLRVQTTTIVSVNGVPQPETLVLESDDYPVAENGVLKLVGRIVGQQGLDAKVITIMFSLQSLKWCIIESKGSADIIIPRPVMQGQSR
jgi:hypothetical protein